MNGIIYTMARRSGGFTDKSKAFTKNIKDEVIKSYTVGRTPIESYIEKYIKNVKGSKLPYDKLYHLFIIIELENGMFILTEKNPNTIFKVVGGNVVENRGAQSFLVPVVVPEITFGEFIDNVKKLQGKKFNQYDALKNNCQDYILDVVKALHSDFSEDDASNDITDFIKQDVSSIMYSSDFKIAKVITDLYGTLTGLVS